MNLLSKAIAATLLILLTTGCASTFITASHKYLDSDRNGVITLEEFANEFGAEPDFREEAQRKGLTTGELAQRYFTEADVDDNGELSVEEYSTWVKNS